MLLSADFDEDFIEVEGIAKALVLSLQATGINGTEFYAPEADRFAADSDATFGQ